MMNKIRMIIRNKFKLIKIAFIIFLIYMGIILFLIPVTLLYPNVQNTFDLMLLIGNIIAVGLLLFALKTMIKNKANYGAFFKFNLGLIIFALLYNAFLIVRYFI